MKNFSNPLLYSLIIVAGLFACKSPYDLTKHEQTSISDHLEIIDEQLQPLAYFNIYRGNTHSHTIFTWTHGEHRKAGISDLSSPTEFHPDFNVPSGVDWKDYNSLSLDPEGYTNRQGLPANHFQLAKMNGYDFYAVSDHTQEPNLQPVSAGNLAWRATLTAAEKYDDDPNFVALSGFEYSRNSNADGGSGHINVLNSSEYVNADHGQRGPALPWPGANWSIPQFYNWVKSAKPHGNKGDVVVGFNHPSSSQYNDWDHIDEEIVKQISTFEVHTNYGRIRWDSYLRALNKGWKVSPIGVHDNHGYTPILRSDLPPPTFVLAPELTREAITRAMKHRRTFASWNEDVELRYAVNGYIMGSTLDSPDKFNFHIVINTPSSKPNERVRRIQILRNHSGGQDDVEIVSEMLFDGEKDEIVWKPVIEDTSAKYFLLVVYHTNDIQVDGKFKSNGSTLSAPIWTGR
jgi:hypothetical protein